MHGMLAGTDSSTLVPLYVATGALVMLAAAYRYWVAKRHRPTFSTSLPERAGDRSPARAQSLAGTTGVIASPTEGLAR